MSSADFDAVIRRTFIRYVEFHEELESTSRLAVELRNELVQRAPALVMTDRQTAGRGRGDHSWWSSAGALTFTVVLDADHRIPQPQHRPLAALAAGLAVRRALRPLLPNRPIFTKWPNDVLVGDAKICGILCEQHAASTATALLIGIGVNVNNSLATAPADVRQRAVSVFDITSQSWDLTEVLTAVLLRLDESLQTLRDDAAAIVREAESSSCLSGRQVTVETPAGTVSGRCTGLSSDGGLRVQTEQGVETIRAGTVVQYETGDPARTDRQGPGDSTASDGDSF